MSTTKNEYGIRLIVTIGRYLRPTKSCLYSYSVYSKHIHPSFSCHLRVHNWQQEIKWCVIRVTKRKSMMRHNEKKRWRIWSHEHKKYELFWSFVFRTQFTFELSLQFLFITYPAVIAFNDAKAMYGFLCPIYLLRLWSIRKRRQQRFY